MFEKGQANLLKAADFPAPVAGIDASSSIYSMAPDVCIYSYNLIHNEYGVTARPGFYEQSTGIPEEVKSMHTYVDGEGVIQVFAVTSIGIYDVSAGGTIGAPVVTWSNQSSTAGFATSVNYETIAGHYLCLCDERNGYWTYDGTTWHDVTSLEMGNAVDPDVLCFVMVSKERLWFVERNTGRGWYLDPGVILGTPSSFDFGNRMSHGGELRCLYNWTVDSGIGIDDIIVAVGGEGDIIIYKGYDPSDAANFNSIGSWYVGAVPAGRQIGADFAGELILLSVKGLISINDLLRGASPINESVYKTSDIQALIRPQLDLTWTDWGWSIGIHPKYNYMFVNSPRDASSHYLQFVMALSTESWGMFRDVPMHGYTVAGDKLYFGDTEGNIHIMDGYSDYVDSTGASDQGVEWSILSSFQNFSNPGSNKMLSMARPTFTGAGVPSYQLQARYDFDFADIGGSSTPVTVTGATWDAGVWDTDVWSGGLRVTDDFRGVTGIGRYVAYALKGTSNFSMTFTGITLLWQSGGFL